MIDFETKIFNRVHAKAAPLCAEKKFTSTFVSTKPTAFPAASLIEVSNVTDRNRQSTKLAEEYAILVYQLDVYATAKTKCKAVLKAVDDEMIAMNFVRTSGQYVPVMDNTKIYRYVARYQVEVDPKGNLFRR